MKNYICHICKVLSILVAVMLSLGVAETRGEESIFSTDYICSSYEETIRYEKPNDSRMMELKTQLMSLSERLRSLDIDAILQYGDEDQIRQTQSILEKRKKIYIELVRGNSRNVLGSLLFKDNRKSIEAIAHDCIEQESTLEGTVEVQIVDYMDHTSKHYYTLITDEGERINLHPIFGLKQSLATGLQVKVRGLQIDSDLLFDGTFDYAEPNNELGGITTMADGGAPLGPASATRDTIVLMVYFQDTPPPNISLVTAEGIMRIVDRYYNENSYNMLDLQGVVDPSESADVFGWYELPTTQTCNINGVETLAIAELQNNEPSVNIGDYEQIVIVAPFGISCGWCGIAYIGGGTSWVQDICFTDDITSHEIGHNLGNDHANFLNCGPLIIEDSGCTNSPYGDVYDNMGLANMGHFNAKHKEIVGFLDSSNILDVTTDGTYTLSPIETNDGGLKAIRLQRGLLDYIYVEYRQPIGYDAQLGPPSHDVFQGALLHRGADGAEVTQLLDVTPPGSSVTPSLHLGNSFVDPRNNNLIRVVSLTPGVNGEVTLDVALNQSGIEYNPPTIDLTSPVNGQEISGTFTVSATADDDTAISTVEFYLIDSVYTVLYQSVTPPPTGNIYSFAMDTTQLHNGQIWMYAKANDVFGNNQNSSIVFFDVFNSQDHNAPSGTIDLPLDGDVTSTQAVDIEVHGTDNFGLWKVEIFKDYVVPPWPAAVASVVPGDVKTDYVFNLDDVFFPTGPHTIMARIYDLQGNYFDSPWLSIDVIDNVDVSPPYTYFAMPPSNPFLDPDYVTPTVSEIIHVNVNSPDNVGTTRVDYTLYDSTYTPIFTHSVNGPPFDFSWKSSTVPNGAGYTFQAISFDAAGNQGFATVTFNVDNTYCKSHRLPHCRSR